MAQPTAAEIQHAADRLVRMADLVESTGLTAAQVGRLIQDHARQSPIEPPAETRKGLVEMTRSSTPTKDFVARLRYQADGLRRLAAQKPK